MRLRRRLAAFGIDYLPILPWVILDLATRNPDGSSALANAAGESTVLGTVVVWLTLLLWLANLVWSCRTGRSLGKAVFGGRVVDAVSGSPIGAWRTLGRNAVLWFSSGWAAIASLFRSDRRGFQDLALKAVVVQEARVPVPQR
jgi:uncharacterized RDD family membrane protein YckC